MREIMEIYLRTAAERAMKLREVLLRGTTGRIKWWLLPGGLPYQPPRWTPITIFIDRKSRTMSTLYGNEAAARALHARSASPAAPSYDHGSVLALVTWAQRDDPHWFGARIPDRPASVEFVTVGPRNTLSYRRFDGPNFVEAHLPSVATAQRTSLLLKLKPASLP